jgi:cytochrome b pre-mRNA-processing protein 3
MVLNFFRKSPGNAAVEAAYQSIVAQSRQPRFYAEWGIADTVTGRFDMITLHLALMLRRLKADPAGAELAQGLVERFFVDMDDSVRELGISDIGVPRKVRNMGQLFYGTLNGLAPALDTGDVSAVEAVLSKNFYGGAGSAGSRALAVYTMAEAEALTTRSAASAEKAASS